MLTTAGVRVFCVESGVFVCSGAGVTPGGVICPADGEALPVAGFGAGGAVDGCAAPEIEIPPFCNVTSTFW